MNKKPRTEAICYIPRSQIDNMIKAKVEEQTKDYANIAVSMAFNFALLTLKDHYGFGEKRLREFTHHMLDLYDDFTANYFDVKDMIEVVKQETNISVAEILREREE